MKQKQNYNKIRYKEWYNKNKEKILADKKAWYEKNKEHVATTKREWYLKNKRRHKNNILKRNYGITIQQFEILLDKQKHRCAVCSILFNSKVVPCIDHCHKTGKIRGVLCHSCNRAIGLLKDNEFILSNAVSYLIDDVVEEELD